jgi:hypothetical protein
VAIAEAKNERGDAASCAAGPKMVPRFGELLAFIPDVLVAYSFRAHAKA